MDIKCGVCSLCSKKAEDRELFKTAMKKIGLITPKGVLAENKDEADKALKKIGLPLIIRPSFTLGGTGGGIARGLAVDTEPKVIQRAVKALSGEFK